MRSTTSETSSCPHGELRGYQKEEGIVLVQPHRDSATAAWYRPQCCAGGMSMPRPVTPPADGRASRFRTSVAFTFMRTARGLKAKRYYRASKTLTFPSTASHAMNDTAITFMQHQVGNRFVDNPRADTIDRPFADPTNTWSIIRLAAKSVV
jgi:hypothetical protein